jgi:restriction endonuclease S subunit
MPKLNSKQFYSFKFRLPPLKEQEKQINQFSKIKALIQELHVLGNDEDEAIRKLASSILNDVFSQYKLLEEL